MAMELQNQTEYSQLVWFVVLIKILSIFTLSAPSIDFSKRIKQKSILRVTYGNSLNEKECLYLKWLASKLKNCVWI